VLKKNGLIGLKKLNGRMGEGGNGRFKRSLPGRVSFAGEK
jgi:hypothetical protein